MSCSVSSLASTSEELSVGESRNEEDGVFPTVNQRLGRYIDVVMYIITMTSMRSLLYKLSTEFT